MIKRIWLVILVLLLGGCSGDEHAELKQWMVENTKDLRGNIPKLPEVKPYEPVPYQVEAMVDPFRPGKIEPESKYRQTGSKGGPFQPDFEARELRNSLLEKYPLESLKMIGYLYVNKQAMAAIQAEDKIKQVKVGDYLGLDFGLVTKISDTEIQLRELIQDSAGDWSERKSSLFLQSKEGSKK